MATKFILRIELSMVVKTRCAKVFDENVFLETKRVGKTR